MMLEVAIAALALPGRDFGVLVLLQSSALMLRALTSFSTQQPVIKLGADAQADSDRDRLGSIVSMGLVVDLFASIVALAIAAFLITLARHVIGLADENVGSAWIFAVSLLFSGFPTANGIFRLYDRFGLLSLIQTFSAIGLFAAYASLFVVGAKLQALVWAWAAYLTLNSMVQLGEGVSMMRGDGVTLRPAVGDFATADGRTLLDYCWSTWGTSTADAIRMNGDSLLIGAIVSVEAAGVYNVARQLAGMLRKFNVILPATVFPEISRLAAAQDLVGAKRLHGRLLWIGTAIGLVAVIAAAALGHLVIRLLFGAAFEQGYVAFVILTAAAAAQLISFGPSMYVQVYSGPKRLLVLYGVASAIFAAAAVVLTFEFSLAGMAMAQLLFGLAVILLCEVQLRTLNMPQRARYADAMLPTPVQSSEE
jgi:O-antigen/teichoic acid export membrane protein